MIYSDFFTINTHPYELDFLYKVKHSSNWYKAVVRLAKQHRRIADICKDALHKLTTYLAKNHGTVSIEDLNVSGMLGNHKLAKSDSR